MKKNVLWVLSGLALILALGGLMFIVMTGRKKGSDPSAADGGGGMSNQRLHIKQNSSIMSISRFFT
ncbi:hypothetical protein AGMMS49928_18740 [Spirochaetia bacterium]|nr:hypothetical protein AGMMS49928_18740 [Spirochaetia bacterium]